MVRISLPEAISSACQFAIDLIDLWIRSTYSPVFTKQ
jgi:hypothetical protein